MTFKEKLAMEHPEEINYDYKGGCKGCPSGHGFCSETVDDIFCQSSSYKTDDEKCTACWNREMPNSEHTPSTSDPVSHPSHYTHSGMECIDEMIMVFGAEAVKHFCVCNAWKYRKRAMYKNGEEDMKKADWYLAKYKELKKNNNG